MTAEAPARAAAAATLPAPAALRAAFSLYFADEAMSAVRHDVLNRLTAIGAIAYELRGLPGLGEGAAPAASADEGGGRLARLGDLNRQVGLLSQTVARRLAPARDPSAAATLADALSAASAACARPRAVRALTSGAARVRGSVTEVAVMLLVLIDNAIEAQAAVEGPASAEVAVEVSWTPTGDEDELEIQVSDQGPGLEDAARERAFERFFTTKPGHAGLGLGVARTLATRLGGQLHLDDRVRREPGVPIGVRASLILPLADVPVG